MIRSTRSVRRLFVLVAALCVFAVPTAALAQDINPTDEEYGNGVVGLAADGSEGPGSTTGDPSDPVAATASTESISELPFTGLDVAAIAAIGVGLVGAGLAVRRSARTREDTV